MAAASPTRVPLPPDTLLLGRYRVREAVGAGACGRVYRAEDTLLPDAPAVAIKEMLGTPSPSSSPARSSPEQQAGSRNDERHELARLFRREVGVLLRLDHPAIPAVHAHWAAPGAHGPFYLAMDYVDGQTLEKALDDGGPLDWHQAAEWGVRLCTALAYLHGHQPPILFRDLKPANVIIDAASGEPRLIDFGIARALGAHGAVGQTLLGTPGYAPFEQWLGRADAASDQYALGATLHALVSGTKASHALARLQAGGLDVPDAMKQLFPPLDALLADRVPSPDPAFAAAITRATSFHAGDRFPDVTAFGVALGEALLGATARALDAMKTTTA